MAKKEEEMRREETEQKSQQVSWSRVGARWREG
jgi:hypothetical protein